MDPSSQSFSNPTAHSTSNPIPTLPLSYTYFPYPLPTPIPLPLIPSHPSISPIYSKLPLCNHHTLSIPTCTTHYYYTLATCYTFHLLHTPNYAPTYQYPLSILSYPFPSVPTILPITSLPIPPLPTHIPPHNCYPMNSSHITMA